jgi:hypothetical protein
VALDRLLVTESVAGLQLCLHASQHRISDEKPSITAALLLGTTVYVPTASADGPSAEELARKAQDPLADTKAIMTDNTIG